MDGVIDRSIPVNNSAIVPGLFINSLYHIQISEKILQGLGVAQSVVTERWP